MISELIRDLARSGIKLGTSQGRLLVNAPPGTAQTLMERIKVNRDALIEELQKLEARADDGIEPIVVDPDRAHLPFPLSDLQLGFYMANDPYMEFHVRPHCYMEIDRTELDIARYEAAWNKALERHALGFHLVNADLQLEKIATPLAIRIAVDDLRHLGATDREASLQATRMRLERRELPLDRWPWFDLSVSRWLEGGVDRYRIHYNHNSFFIDGYATTQFLAEIEEYYRRPELELQPRTLSYRDAVLAIRALEQTEQGQKARQYWMSMLAGLPPPPPLPQLATLDRRVRSRLDRRCGTLSKSSWDAFKRNAHANKLTPSNAVITAYAYVIALWCNSEHFIFSQMVTRRFAELHPEIKTLIGNFASLYPLQIELDRSLPFSLNAARIQDRVMLDIAHLQYGGMQVLQELNKLKGGFGAAPSPFVVGSGLFMKEYRKYDYVLLETSQTLLDHQFFELPDGTYYYVWDLLEAFFPPGLIDGMWQAFERLLGQLCDDLGMWSTVLGGIVAEREFAARQRCNQTSLALPSLLLHEPLSTQARDHAERVAVKHSKHRLTYAQLDRWSDCIADELGRLAGPAGKTVAVVMPRCCEMVAAVMGILKAGAAYVPIDPDLPAKRRDYLIRNVESAAVVTLPALREQLEWPAEIAVLTLDSAHMTQDVAGARPSARVAPSELAYIIHTSGTTGQPKGVMIEHGAAMNTVLDINRRLAIGPADKIFGVSAFNFDLSVYDIFGAVAAGATVVYPSVESALDPTHWLSVIESEQITVWNSVPALMSLLVETAAHQGKTLPSLRWVMLSGDKIPTNLPERIRRVAPRAAVLALGGATEAAIWSIFYPLEAGRQHGSMIPYGYPLANQRWHIRDRHGCDVPTWVAGELLIAGDGLARGYCRDDVKTARSFITDATGERLYRTGDLGRYLPDGCIEILGRIDHQVKLRGHRIELGEIEATLLRHPDVTQAVVAVQQSGQRQAQQLAAYICVTRPGEHIPSQLERYLAQELPAYMIPTQWLVLEELPRTANGKIDRGELAAIHSRAAQHSTPTRTYVAAHTEEQRVLVSIWQEVLQLERIGIHDDFFDLGGQSFDAIRIFTSIRNTYGCAFTLGDIWQTRTIAAFAERLIHPAGAQGADALVAISTASSGQPLFLVHPAGGTLTSYVALAQQALRPVYGLQARWRVADVPSPSSVASLAAEYIKALQSTQPQGPYTLAGWSSGGVIAFEMARQLECAGKAVERLFLLDAPTPRSHADLSSGKVIAWFMEDLALGLPVERLQQELFAGLSAAPTLALAIDVLQPHSPVELSHAQLLPIYQVFIDMVTLVSSYVPGQIASDVTVVRVRDNIVSEFAAHPCRARPDWGWRPFVRGQLNCLTVSGNHHSFLAADSVGAWAHVFHERPSRDPALAMESASCSSC